MITSKWLPNQIDKTIDKMYYAELARKTRYYEPLFTSAEAPRGEDVTEATLSELGILRVLGQGQGVDFDVPEEGNKITRTYSKYGLGVQITEEAIQDELFGKIEQVPTALADSAIERTEKLTADLFNYGATAVASGGTKAEDSNPLFYATHTTLKGAATIANYAATALTTTSLEAAFAYGDVMVGENGFIRPIKPIGVLCHPALKWVVNDLLKATGRVWDYTYAAQSTVHNSPIVYGSSAQFSAYSQAPNQLNPSNGIVDGWKVFLNPYLTDTDAWYVIFEGYDLRILYKYRPKLTNDGDFSTDNKVYKVKMRLMTFTNKYKYLYGSVP
jgi:hypothetical protein